MHTKMKTLTVGILTAIMLTTGISLPSAEAQNNSRQQGLVNVQVYDVIDDVTIVIRDVYVDVGLGVAANILANVCGVSVPVAVLGAAGVAGTFECMNEAGDAGAIVTQ
jgi:hypothetical protein